MSDSEVTRGGKVSDVTIRIEVDEKAEENELDKLVARASTPSLASLFKAGKNAGLLKTGTNWSGSE